MGIAYSCDKDKGISYEVWEGLITGSDWVAHIRRQVADREWPAGDKSVTDVQMVSSDSSIEKADLEQVMAIYRAQPAKLAQGRAAVVASQEFRSSQLFQIFTSRHGFRLIVFNDLNLACKWLGIDTKDAERSVNLLRAKLVGENSQQPRKTPPGH